MKCEEVKKLLVAYLDGEVTPAKRTLIELHLSTCQQCQVEMETLKGVVGRLRRAMNAKADEVASSPDLWEKLQHRLETTAPPSFRERYDAWLNRPLWRAAVPVALVVIVVTLWGTGVLPGLRSGKAPVPTPSATVAAPTVIPRPTTAPSTTVPAPVITIPPAPTPTPAPVPAPTARPRMDFELDRTPDINAAYGGNVTIDLSFTNKASEPRLMSPFPPEIKIVRLPDVQPPSVVVRSFAVGTQGRLLQSGEKAIYDLTWDQRDDSGQQLAPGWYGVEVAVLYRNPSEPTGGSIRGVATRVLIQPPGGVMEKTIDVNKSLTVNGLTFTLERVELTTTGMKVYAFNAPPGYSLPPGQPGPAPSLWLHAEAEYSFDGGAAKQAFPSGINFLDNGVKHSWSEYLDPAPKDAKVLTFRITRLSGGPGQSFEGPWEFRIPLN